MVDLAPRPIGRPPSCTCGSCRKCRNAAYMRAWWAKKTLEQRRTAIAGRDPERVAAYERERSRSKPKLLSVRRSQLRYPVRHAARLAVHTAIRRGDLVRQPCHCGISRSEAHHPDYSRPLEVEWLCRRHHVERHAE